MLRIALIAGSAVVLSMLASPLAVGRVVWMDELDLSPITQGWGEPKIGRSVQNKPIELDGKGFKRGVGLHASGAIRVALDGRAERFQATVGVNDATRGRGSVTIKAYGDEALLFKSDVLRGGQPPVDLDLDLSGVRHLVLVMGDGGDDIHYDHVDWADAKFLVEGSVPKIVAAAEEERVILTPKPPKAPRINGPRLTGVRPGRPLLFRIPCTGERPMHFEVEGIPKGLEVAPDTGFITGRIADESPRIHHTTVVVENAHGRAERELRIAVGETLALTPPMGYNHWYAHYNRITDAMMREAADVMVETGMADVGYQYVNIDDCWMNAPKYDDPMRVGPLRDEDGNLICNQHFPDMKALTDYIHEKGLRAGTYISPGPLTCAGFAGSWEHEAQDARQFAEWGFDFLKYDWCSYGQIAKDDSLDELKKPYLKMSALLRKQDRDIVLNLCQYGMGEVWKWGEEVGGNCWRTAGDLGFELTGYHRVAERNAAFHEHARPGAWNDPDYLLIGYVGRAHGMGEPEPCPLTPNEQYSYMSLWCLMASPLFYSGDMSRMDEFTLNVLCNPEVIEINQDPLGKQGYPVAERDEGQVWRKELEDGALAVGLFNRSEVAQTVSMQWQDIGVTGKQALRDLWRHKDLGVHEGEYSARIPRHGVLLLRIRAAM